MGVVARDPHLHLQLAEVAERGEGHSFGTPGEALRHVLPSPVVGDGCWALVEDDELVIDDAEVVEVADSSSSR